MDKTRMVEEEIFIIESKLFQIKGKDVLLIKDGKGRIIEYFLDFYSKDLLTTESKKLLMQKSGDFVWVNLVYEKYGLLDTETRIFIKSISESKNMHAEFNVVRRNHIGS